MMKLLKDTDAGWERLGKVDPYWAVLTEEIYRHGKLEETARSNFSNPARSTYSSCST